MSLSYFVLASQTGEFDFIRSLLPHYCLHPTALARPACARALRVVEVVAFGQLGRVGVQKDQAWFSQIKMDAWEEDQASMAVELIRLRPH